MKNVLKAIIGFFVIFCITGCSIITVDEVADPSPKSMLVKVEDTIDWRIYYHKSTKVMYIKDTSGGFTIMVNEEGKPLLWRGE